MDEFEMIPSDQWQVFCDEFSRSHRGWLIRIWVVDTVSLEAGSAETFDMAVRDLELAEVSLEHHGERFDLVIMARDGETHTDHLVRGVSAVMQEHDVDGNPSGLRIDSSGGQTTLVRFRVPARPETLDGLAPGEKA